MIWPGYAVLHVLGQGPTPLGDSVVSGASVDAGALDAPRFSGVIISLNPVIWVELTRAVISQKYSRARKES